jgi:malto-oligosyltrehalose synthase
LHHEFTFDDARRLLDYLDGLGITHLYLSPITAAAPESMHGYDVVDPSRINPELGGEEGFRVLAHAARSRGMGIILDIVPNHMSTHERNRQWTDVLRLGRSSAYAHWFDIDWEARDEMAVRGKVLLPVLGDELDRVVRRGELKLEVSDGERYLRYFDRRFPLAPGTFDTDVRAVLERQHYVLEFWREAKSHVDYRRFFTIDELIGIRVEDIDVFHETHELFARLMREGLIDGVRVDHADGLSDPAEYFRRLRALLGDQAYIVAEKILSADESLPADWPLDGTTGYEFMDLINSVFIDSRHEEELTAIYATSTGRSTDFEALAYRCRKRVIDGPLRGQFERASRQLYRSIESPHVDRTAFTSALHELLACMPVYRTYHSVEAVDPAAERVLGAAAGMARKYATGTDTETLHLVARLLAGPPDASRIAVMRLQQLMPAVQAKAVEDSAFYRYLPLASLCEVGSEPTVFGRSVVEFHAKNLERSSRWPASMLATATHDHKRGEDVRARLNALSELPDEWQALLDSCRGRLNPGTVSALDEYLLYQTLIGIWPEPAHGGETSSVAERAAQYLTKAAREAGERTNWDAPNEEYEAALEQFASRATETFAVDATSTVPGLLTRTRALGEVNSLGQAVLKAVSPGVADTYRGTELWDLSLVDPDNRRPVDYEHRAALLRKLQPLMEETPVGIEARRKSLPSLIEHSEDGAIKLYVLARALRRRRALHPLCIEGDYVPVDVEGPLADHVVAFARRLDKQWLVAAVTRLAAPISNGLGMPIDWKDTALILPADFAGSVRNILTEEEAAASLQPTGAVLPVQGILATLPVAIIEPDPLPAPEET